MPLQDLFENLQNAPNPNNSDYLKILKELTASSNKKRFSQLSEAEIKIFAKLSYLQWLLKQKYGKDIFDIDQLLNSFLELRFNLDRMSRKEFVDAFKGERTNNLERGLIRNMIGGNQNQGFVR